MHGTILDPPRTGARASAITAGQRPARNVTNGTQVLQVGRWNRRVARTGRRDGWPAPPQGCGGADAG
jgi:hypothetical protein